MSTHLREAWGALRKRSSTETPPYPRPAKCEATTRVRRRHHEFGEGSPYGRCQKEPTTWNAKEYAWLCDLHERAARRRS